MHCTKIICQFFFFGGVKKLGRCGSMSSKNERSLNSFCHFKSFQNTGKTFQRFQGLMTLPCKNDPITC